MRYLPIKNLVRCGTNRLHFWGWSSGFRLQPIFSMTVFKLGWVMVITKYIETCLFLKLPTLKLGCLNACGLSAKWKQACFLENLGSYNIHMMVETQIWFEDVLLARDGACSTDAQSISPHLPLDLYVFFHFLWKRGKPYLKSYIYCQNPQRLRHLWLYLGVEQVWSAHVKVLSPMTANLKYSDS